MDAPRILCIAGSPRRRGNSDMMLDACIEGIEHAGGLAERLVVASADVGACRGCNGCRPAGTCIVRDGMADVYPRIDAADGFVVATPVYFATVPAVLKALYDRLQPYWVRRYVQGHPQRSSRPGALLVASGGGDPYGYACVETTTRSALGILGVDPVHVIVAENVDDRGDVERMTDILANVRRAGEELVSQAVSEGSLGRQNPSE